MVTLCWTYPIPIQQCFWPIGYPGHKQGNQNNGAGKRRRERREQQRRNRVRERGEALGETHERGRCSGQCDNVSPPGTLGAVLSFQFHRLSVPMLNGYVSKLPFCAATATFRRNIYVNLGVIIAMELKGEGE